MYLLQLVSPNFTLVLADMGQYSIRRTTKQHKMMHQGPLPQTRRKMAIQIVFITITMSDFSVVSLFFNIMDAIKEGDGNRLMQCYKVVLLFEFKFKHTKYAYILLLLFAKVYALLSEKEAVLLVHNRFLNKKGKKGVNIPLDHHMEHLNLVLNKLLQAVDVKITEAAAQR